MPKTLDVEPCPFCFGEDLYVDTDASRYGRLSGVLCLTCMASGPCDRNLAEAVRLWNEVSIAAFAAVGVE